MCYFSKSLFLFICLIFCLKLCMSYTRQDMHHKAQDLADDPNLTDKLKSQDSLTKNVDVFLFNKYVSVVNSDHAYYLSPLMCCRPISVSGNSASASSFSSSCCISFSGSSTFVASISPLLSVASGLPT